MWALYTFVLAAALLGCQENLKPSDKNGRFEMNGECGKKDSSPRLVVTTIEPGNYPYQTKVIAIDLAQRSYQMISEGESSDTALFRVNNCEGYLFNRTEESHNFRHIVKTDDQLLMGPQIAYNSAAISDPAVVIPFGNTEFILANYISGSIAQVDRTTGATVTEKKDSFGLAANTSLRAADIILKGEAPHFQLLVVHDALVGQGLEALVGTSQALLAFDASASGWVPSTRYQNLIPLTGSFPHFLAENDGKQILLSYCAKFMREPKRVGKCRSVVERVDPVSGQSEVLWDLDTLPYSSNGAHIADPQQVGSFYASVERHADGVKVLAHFDISAKTVKEIRTYERGSYGSWYAGFDLDQKYLLIGDGAGDHGSLTIYDIAAGTEVAQVPLSGAPTSGLWLR